MIRISTIFIAICMVLVAASLGLVLYAVAGISGTESAIVALTALTFLILYNAVSMRLRDRSDVGGQIADLSRGTADLARQVAEFGRRLAAVEGRIASSNSTNSDRVQSVVGEINELGGLVRQLAATVSTHEDLLAGHAPAPAPVARLELEPEAPIDLIAPFEERPAASPPLPASPPRHSAIPPPSRNASTSSRPTGPWRPRWCWSSSSRPSAASDRPRPRISRHSRSAASASRSTTSPTCGSSRANSPTAACASS